MGFLFAFRKSLAFSLNANFLTINLNLSSSFISKLIMRTKHIILTALLLSMPLAKYALHAVEDGKKKIVFVAGTPSHGYGAHEHKAGSILLSGILNDKLGDKIKAVVVSGGWPKDSKAAFKNADALVFFCTGGGRHFVLKHLDETKALNKRPCKNYIRKCRSQLDESYTKKMCENCLEKGRIKDTNNYICRSHKQLYM